MGKNTNKCEVKSDTKEEDCLLASNLLQTKRKKVKQSTNTVSEVQTNVENNIVLEKPKNQKKRKHQVYNTEKVQELIVDSSSCSKKEKQKASDSLLYSKDICDVLIDKINTDVKIKIRNKRREDESEETNTEAVCQITEETIPKKKRNNEKTDNQVIKATFKELESEIKLKEKKIYKLKKTVTEETVEDEELDEFCNELDDEANEKYEKWIKQLEIVLKK